MNARKPDGAAESRQRRRAWRDDGTDPDYRFTLANERTFLAWIRTALALLAACVAVGEWAPRVDNSVLRWIAGAGFGVGGLALAVLAYPRWARNERAMRLGRSLPFTPALLVVGLVVSLAVAGVALLAVMSGR
jgi:putative membrane protein